MISLKINKLRPTLSLLYVKQEKKGKTLKFQWKSVLSNQRVSEILSRNKSWFSQSEQFCAIRGNTDNRAIVIALAIRLRLGLSSTSRVMAGMEEKSLTDSLSQESQW